MRVGSLILTGISVALAFRAGLFIHGPRDAIRLGIGMVHQHVMLIPPLTVAENIVLGHEPGGPSSVYEVKKAREVILALSKQYGLPIEQTDV